MTLRAGKAACIQQPPDDLGATHQFGRVVRVAMPGEEVQWRGGATALFQEFQDKLRRLELAFLKLSRMTESRPANFQVWILAFDGSRRGGVKAQEFFIVPRPHGRTILRLVPNLPIT